LLKELGHGSVRNQSRHDPKPSPVGEERGPAENCEKEIGTHMKGFAQHKHPKRTAECLVRGLVWYRQE